MDREARLGIHAQPHYIGPIAPGPALHTHLVIRGTLGLRLEWGGIRDLQVSPGGPEAVGGGSLYTSRLLLLVTSEPWGYKGPTPCPRESKRGRDTHSTPCACCSGKRHESLTRDLYLGIRSAAPRIPVVSCPTQGPPVPSIETFIYPTQPKGSPSASLGQVVTAIYTEDPCPIP